jgi:hypothetical protein
MNGTADGRLTVRGTILSTEADVYTYPIVAVAAMPLTV